MVTVTLSDRFKLEVLISSLPEGRWGCQVSFTYLIEFFTVLLLFELLPVPIDFDILLMGGNNFVLDLVCSLLLGLFLRGSAVSLSEIGVGFDLVYCALSLSDELLKITYSKNSDV